MFSKMYITTRPYAAVVFNQYKLYSLDESMKPLLLELRPPGNHFQLLNCQPLSSQAHWTLRNVSNWQENTTPSGESTCMVTSDGYLLNQCITQQ